MNIRLCVCVCVCVYACVEEVFQEVHLYWEWLTVL